MELSSVVPWGRSFEEYEAMFLLTEQDLTKKILGCSDGPAAFNCTMTKAGRQISSIDPTYQFSADQLRVRIDEVYTEIMEQMEKTKDNYLWSTIPSVAELGRIRMESMQDFLDDFEEGKKEGRYQFQQLPTLTFTDKQFDLALCSHFLFLYSEHFSLEEHLTSVLELYRVASEVRIYPLLTLKGEPSPFVEPVMEKLRDMHISVRKETVTYQFQKGATEMLVVG